MEKIQFTKGCPNNCNYCYEPNEMKYYDPEIPLRQSFQINDMNFLANPNHIEILEKLQDYNSTKELICGIDYRRLNQKICDLLFKGNFIKIRWAWDYGFFQQKKHQKVWKMFKKAGYKSEELSVFILVNWKIPYIDCVKNGGYKRAKPHYWDINQIKRFRGMCRKHNQMVLFKIDPELK